MKNNPLRLAEDRILAEQLKLLLGYVRDSVIGACLLFILLAWTLANYSNGINVIAVWAWCAIALLSRLYIGFHYATRHLAAGISVAHARPLVRTLIVLQAADGAILGSLAWLTLDYTTTAGSVLVVAVLAGSLGSIMAQLSPVLPVFFAKAIPLLVILSVKLWQMGDPSYTALGAIGILYLFGIMTHALNSSIASTGAINLRFELMDSQERLRKIEQRQILSQERQRLMQDMHDGLGSSLTSALRVAEHGHIDKDDVAQLLKGCIDDLKLTIDSMEPVDADLLLLLATLRYRIGLRLESTGIALRWEVEDVPKLDWLAPKNALHILRILQEAITNIIKHTQATEIRVATGVDGGHVVVKVTDNGQGFDVEQALKSGGKGLLNQMRRAEVIGAEIKWESNNAGTQFTLRLPIKNQQAIE